MQDIVMNILGMISCTMSIIGGLIIVVSYYKLPELKTFGNKMIMYVGMSNTIYSLQTFLEFLFDLNELYEDKGLNTLCMIQGFISTYTSQCMIIWITILSLTIHDTVKNKIQNMAKRERIFIILGFIIPLILSVIPFISDTYGRENGVCWITSRAGYVAEILQVWGLFYAPLWICIFLNFSLILSTMKMLKALDIGNTETYFVIRRFLYYPCLWIICWLAGTINRSIVSAGGQGVIFLTDIALVLTCSQGFFTMIIFLSDKRILEAIRNSNSLSKTQVCNQDQQNCDGEGDNNHDNSQFQSKLLEVDDQDDYFNYYTSDNNPNQKKKDIEATNNHLTNDSDSSVLSQTEQQNQWTSLNPQTQSLKLSSDSTSSNQQNCQSSRSPNRKQNNGGNNSQRKKPSKRCSTQKQQFLTSGQWNRMEKIEEDSDEELFDKEIQLMNIKTSEQLFLSKRDTKLLYKQRKISNAHNQSENLHKRIQE